MKKNYKTKWNEMEHRLKVMSSFITGLEVGSGAQNAWRI